MAGFNTTGRNTSPGVNDSNVVTVEHVVTAAMAAADTLDVRLDTGASKDLVPVAAGAFSAPSSGVRTAKPMAITSCDLNKGTARLTVGATALVVGDVVFVVWRGLSQVAPTGNAAPYITAAGVAT